MAEVNHESTWNLSLTTSELRLVLKALGGRLKPEDIISADELGDRLTLLRSNATQSLITAMEHNAAMVERKNK